MNYSKKSIRVWITILLLLIPYPLLLTPSIAHAALTDGLVGYWTFDGRDTNWGTNKTNDRSGSGNTGTMTSMSTTTSPVAGKIGQGLKFDGVDDWILSTTAYQFAGDYTVSVWFKTSVNTQNSRFFDKAVSSDSYVIFGFRSDVACSVGSANAGVPYFAERHPTLGVLYNICGTTTLPVANEWHLLTKVRSNVTGSSASHALYLDGVLLQSGEQATTPTTWNATVTRFGSYAGAGDWFNGSLDDLRIYNRALSAQEVKLLYNSGAVRVASSPTTVLTSGLVGYWTFDGNDTNWGTNKTNDRAGTNHGTMTSMSTTTTPVAGKAGQGFKFDGVDDYVNMGLTNDITGDAITVSAWVRPTLFSGNKYVVSKTSPTGFIGYGMNVTNTGTVRFFEGDGALKGSTSATALTLNKWAFITGVYDGANVMVYINGVQNGTPLADTGNISSASAASLLVAGWNQGTVWFSGGIDDVRVYNRALSAQEVKLLYNSGAVRVASSPTTVLTSGLVGYWTFDGKDTNWGTNKTNDRSGSGNTGTMTSMSTTTTPVAGKAGQGFKFDGVDDYIGFSTATNLGLASATSEKSICAWIKPTSGVTSTSIFTIYPGSNNYLYILSLNGSGVLTGSIRSDNGDDYTIFAGSGAINNNKWYFVCWTRTSGKVNQLYVNASPNGSPATDAIILGITPVASSVSIGRNNGVYANYFKGSIDDVRIYNRALSAGEVAQLYKQGTSIAR